MSERGEWGGRPGRSPRSVDARAIHPLWRRAAIGALATVALAVVACGSGSAQSGAGSRSSTGARSGSKTDLTVEYWPHGRGAGGKRVWKLTCQPTGGDHPARAQACAELGRRNAFAPPSAPCALVIVKGTPEAEVQGRFQGAPVSMIVRPRCGTAWQRLHVLLTGR
jgi:hypothetical protein